MTAGTRGRALVTGASSGLGASFAHQLAAAGTDLVLVARTADALERLAGELRQAHGVDTEVLPADLADRAQVATVAERIGAGDVDTVVNNAGFGFYGPVSGHGLDQELGMVDVDVAAVVALSHAAVQAMAPRGRGALLNVASVAAFAPTPESATYSAAKSFVLLYTEALHDELAGTGVRVTVLCPGFTRTNFQANAGITGKGLPGFVWAEADEVVRRGLEALARNQAVCVPGVVNKVTALTPRLAPRPVVRRIARQVMKRL
ncbi:MAG: SDR family oxidoreductase [Acidobacteriota bacterium]|nr:SDR family oxidoreductase [Acidobacteriota bacterium]